MKFIEIGLRQEQPIQDGEVLNVEAHPKRMEPKCLKVQNIAILRRLKERNLKGACYNYN